MTVEVVRELPMTWADDEALVQEVRGEDIDGLLVMRPHPSRQHQSASRRSADLLVAHVPNGHEVTERWGREPRADESAPDVMVHPRTEEQTRSTGTPLLCVETPSSNRSDDLVRQVFERTTAGLPSCWALDPLEASLRTVAPHGGEHRRTSLVTGVGGAPGWPGVTIDVAALLAT